MAKFITCTNSGNNNVNIDLCKSMRKIQIPKTPQQEPFYGIDFMGCNTIWAYVNEKNRDIQFNIILKGNS